MNINEFRVAAVESANVRQLARTQGENLAIRFKELLDQVQPGAEDPILRQLAGEKLSEIVQRTKWSSLVINPGSTSTKVAVYSGLTLVASDEVTIDPGEPDSIDLRVSTIVQWVKGLGLDFKNLTGIAARGGFLAPVPVATYRISDEMCKDLENAPHKHASNMAVPMALEMGKLSGPDTILTVTDPVTCDEIDPVYRLTGSSRVRTDGSGAHYLNLRAVCELTARLLDVQSNELNLIPCHMGGGMSAARYQKGTMAQVLHAFGTFPSANRSGSLPFKELLRMAEERIYNFDDLREDIVEGKGGLLSLTGTSDFRKLFEFEKNEASSQQKEKIALLRKFFAQKVASGILELCAIEDSVDGILLTGGLANNADFCTMIADRIPLPIPVTRIPGSVESQSLAAGLLRAAADPTSRQNYVQSRDWLAKKRSAEDDLFDVPIFAPPEPPASSRLDSLDKIIAAASDLDEIPTVAVVGGDNEEALLAAKLASEYGQKPLAKFVFLGPFGRISELAWELDIPIDEENFFIVDTDDPVSTAMELYREGIVDTVMKGSISTAALLKGYIRTAKSMGQLPKGNVLSHVTICELSGRDELLTITDAAINPEPDLKTRMKILENALGVLKLLGITKPKVAVIAPTEKPSAKVVSSMEGEEIEREYQNRQDVIVEGPISVDLALSPDSVREKHYKGRIQGDADILLVPTLDVGNAVYKSFTVTGSATVAGAVVGCGAPMILTSRGDTSRTKFASIALALVLTRRGGIS